MTQQTSHTKISDLQPLFDKMTLAARIKYNLKCFENDPPHNQFAKGMKQMLDDLAPYAEHDIEAELLEALDYAEKELTAFYRAAAYSLIKAEISIGQFLRIEKMRKLIKEARRQS